MRAGEMDQELSEWKDEQTLLQFDREKHTAFLRLMHNVIPHLYESQEINHLTLAYFIISGLDILDSLHLVDKDAVGRWILSFQVSPTDKVKRSNGQFYGFCGSRSSQYPSENGVSSFNYSHLASTYCALAILKIVGYSLSAVNKELISSSLRTLQKNDGSFIPLNTGGEIDLRFTFCAVAICFLLGDWSGIDREKAKDFILGCQSYDGGFGMAPGLESHGGGTYCAVASLRLMGYLEDDTMSKGASSSIINIPLLLEWCLQRQTVDGGFQGRANKACDTCYAFWIGSVLSILGAVNVIDVKALRCSLLKCQSKYGGFGKFPSEPPDLYHSYYGISVFGFLDEPGIKPVCPELGLTYVANPLIYL